MKKQWEFHDYVVLGIIVLFIFAFCYSCTRNLDKNHQEAVEAAYIEGYEQGYYDGENGLPYNEDR